MTDALQQLSDCVVRLQGESHPACSQTLGLQSKLVADMLQNTKLEMTDDGRKVIPFADDEPAKVQLIKSIHMLSREQKQLVSELSLSALARLLSLARKYQFVDHAWRLLEDLCNPFR